VDRIEWRLADGGDPAALVEDFLAGYGLAVRDLTGRGRHRSADRICGAALMISAAGAAQLVTAAGAAQPAGPAGPVSPAPAVPDVVAVVYVHAPELSAVDGPEAAVDWSLGRWRPSWSPQSHADAVAAVREAIARGDVYQVNVVGHASAAYHGDPMPALRRVAALPGARYGGVLRGQGWAVACASPETLVEVVDGRVVTRPIKGTRPATRAGRAQLLSSAKERAEHVMIVDLERNDLAMIAVTGSVRVDELYAVRRWCGLWQAESVVSAQVAPGVGLAALLRAVCPGGSVTGAPKLAALELIAAVEPVGRGPSMGVLGWVGSDRIDLGLSIRTVGADAERLHLWAGGGVTWGSEPAAEVSEAAAKAAPLRAALAGR